LRAFQHGGPCCKGDPSYGKTETGKWLTGEEAVKEGYRAAKPKAVKD